MTRLIPTTLGDAIAPDRTALIVFDMQKGILISQVEEVTNVWNSSE